MGAENICKRLVNAIGNVYGAYGLVGNLYAESALNSMNMQNSYETKLGYSDETYTQAVDNGEYTNFAKDSVGYGLAQWTYSTRKANLLAWAQNAGKSIGDEDMQIDFLLDELQNSYSSVWKILCNATSIQEASDAVLTKYEKPADQSDSVKTKRAGYGQTYYEKYGDFKEVETMSYLRSKVKAQAEAWIGLKESDGSYQTILDVYNSQSSLPRSYKMTTSDAWCAAFATAVFVKLSYLAIFPCAECSCSKMITAAKSAGIWVEDDSYVPSIGDLVLYDWDDTTGTTSDNTGTPDHVGIVTSVNTEKKTFVVTEGNKSDAVGQRTMNVNGKYIRGFITPKYTEETTTTTTTGSSSDSDSSLTYKVGDIVNFTGTTHYTSASASSGKTCKPGVAEVTQVKETGKHPYHLIATEGSESNVYGWVNKSTISGKATTTTKSIEEVAQEVIAGKWGNGDARKEALEAAGYDYDAVQAKVNELVAASSIKTYTHKVVKGDTLSAIAKKYGTTVSAIVSENKSKYSKISANYIVVGWTLSITV